MEEWIPIGEIGEEREEAESQVKGRVKSLTPVLLVLFQASHSFRLCPYSPSLTFHSFSWLVSQVMIAVTSGLQPAVCVPTRPGQQLGEKRGWRNGNPIFRSWATGRRVYLTSCSQHFIGELQILFLLETFIHLSIHSVAYSEPGSVLGVLKEICLSYFQFRRDCFLFKTQYYSISYLILSVSASAFISKLLGRQRQNVTLERLWSLVDKFESYLCHLLAM